MTGVVLQRSSKAVFLLLLKKNKSDSSVEDGTKGKLCKYYWITRELDLSVRKVVQIKMIMKKKEEMDQSSSHHVIG